MSSSTPARGCCSSVGDNEGTQANNDNTPALSNANVTKRPTKRQALDSPPQAENSSEAPITRSDLRAIVEEITDRRSETLLAQLTSSLRSIMSSELSTMRNEIKELRESITFVSDQYDKVVKENKETRELVRELRVENESMKSTVIALTEQLQLKEQSGRINNIEISGVPLIKGENLNNILNRIATKVGFKILPTDVDCIHRVRRYPLDSKPSTLAPNIIVRFTQRTRKSELLALIRTRRGLSTADLDIDGPAKPVFVNDHLSPQNKVLYGRARKIGKELNYKFIWLSDCKIFVRKNESTKAILISNANDLDKIK